LPNLQRANELRLIGSDPERLKGPCVSLGSRRSTLARAPFADVAYSLKYLARTLNHAGVNAQLRIAKPPTAFVSLLHPTTNYNPAQRTDDRDCHQRNLSSIDHGAEDSSSSALYQATAQS
jgi:hypothetical protein